MIEFPSFPRPRVSVLVVTFGGWTWTERTLRALRSHTEMPYEVVVVDNASADETPRRLREDVRGARVVLNERNEGFGPANNAAADRARGELLVLLNPDALVRPGWLEPLVETLDRDPGVGAAVPRLLELDGAVQECGSVVWADGSTWAVGAGAPPEDPMYRFRRTVDYGSAACLVIRRETFRRIGGFHPAYRPAYCEDVDLALALRAEGLRTAVDPRSEVVHVRFGAVGREAAARLIRRNREVLVRRWRATLAEHPPPYRPDRPHRLWAGRDREAPERILVVGERPAAALLRALAGGYGRVTMLCAPGWSGPVHPDLLDGGVEVASPPDPGAWLRARRFHYSAAVLIGGGPGRGAELAEVLADSQPQAEVLEEEAPPRPDRVLVGLERAGIRAEPAGGRRVVR
jgi:O-antigen biosynthesis protein